MTRIEIDITSPVPPYEQIRAQVAGLVAAGLLRTGDRLPTVRTLAADLGVATGTVARAYRELEGAGLVTSRRRLGTVVTGTGIPAPETVVRAAGELVVRARAAGLTHDDLLGVVAAAWRHHPVARPHAPRP